MAKEQMHERHAKERQSMHTKHESEVKAMQDSLSADLGAPVEIRKNAANGHITITFYSEEELENILRRLGQAG